MSTLEMNIDLSAIKKLQGDMDNVPEATKAGLERVANHAKSMALRFAGQINKRPIPTKAQVKAFNRKTGASPGKVPKRVGGRGDKAWTRTGGLIRAIDSSIQWVNGTSIMMLVDLPYGLARHDLGTPLWIPKKPALGIIRKNDFFNQTEKAIEPQVERLFMDGYGFYMRSH